MSLLERNSKQNKSAKNIRKPPVFIIGAPRSGSTILYQLITNSKDVLYINNFINLFHRNLYSGFLLNERFFGLGHHNCFSSEFGNTLNCGWKAPSESGNFWYNWLDRSNDYHLNNKIDESSVEKIRNVIFTIVHRFNRPLVFKNLNNSLRLPLLHRISKKNKILWIKRDPRYTVQSILLARRGLEIPTHQVWSVNPFDNYSFDSEIELIVNQVYKIEKIIKQDIDNYGLKTLIVDYENLKDRINDICEFCNIETLLSTNAINVSNKVRVEQSEWQEIEDHIGKLNWDYK